MLCEAVAKVKLITKFNEHNKLQLYFGNWYQHCTVIVKMNHNIQTSFKHFLQRKQQLTIKKANE